MSGIGRVSVEDYLRYSEKPNAEYRDGVLIPKAMPTAFHAIIQYALLVLLRNQGAQALPELTVRISPSRFLVPDVCVVEDLVEPYPTKSVLLCCEILSAEDRLGAMLAKCEEYHAWGVPFCWVIDPMKQTACEYHSGSEPVRADSNSSLRAGEFSVNLAQLFAALKS